MSRELPAQPSALHASARWLGFAGLAPQIFLALIIIGGPVGIKSAASGAALAYSGTILSFIGGAWWGLAWRSPTDVRWVVWVAAVIPSLIAFAAICVWAIGLLSKQSLFITGASLIATLIIDYELAASGVSPRGWLRLRVPLSIGLGSLTILIAILS